MSQVSKVPFSVISPVQVQDGGTGDVTLTAHGVLIGEGTSPINVTSPGTVGQVFTSNGSTSDPTFQNAAVGVPEQQIYYVGKHGSNSNAGTTIGQAFLTFGYALTIASSQTPTATNRYVIQCFDDGIYTEDIVGVAYVDIFAPNANLVATTIGLTVADNANYTFQTMSVPTGSSGVVKPSTQTTTSWVTIAEMTCAGTGAGFSNLATGGILMCEWKTLTVNNGTAIGNTVSTTGHTHVRGGDIYFVGTTGTAVGLGKVTSGSIVGNVDHILNMGSGSGTAIHMVGGVIDVNVNTINATTALSINGITGSTTLNLMCNDLTGAQTISNGAVLNIWSPIPVGVSGQVLTSNGPGVLPSWGNPSSSLIGTTDSATPYLTALGSGAGTSVTGVDATMIGYQAGLNTTTATNVTSIGYQAGYNNISGNSTVNVGAGAGYAQSTQSVLVGYNSGYYSTNTGSVGIGYLALRAGTGGGTSVGTVAIGYGALENANGLDYGVAIGYNAMGDGSNSSTYCIGIGYNSLQNATSCTDCIGIGRNALLDVTSTNASIAIGTNCLEHNAAAGELGIGYEALQANTSGTDNTAIGYQALNAISTSTDCTAVGYQSQKSNTSGFNTSLGSLSMYSNNAGAEDTAIGFSAMYTNLSGTNCTATGYEALYSNSTNNSISAYGAQSLYNCTGDNNDAFGYLSAYNTTTGVNNCAFGTNSLFTNTVNSYNTAVGYKAMYENDGSNNTAIGFEALGSATGSTNSTCIGYSAGSNYTGTEANNICIGYNVSGKVGESNAIRIGNSSNLSCNIAGITGTSPIDLNAPQVVLCDDLGNLSAISSSTATYVLTSNGPGTTPTFQANGGGGIGTIDGDSGSITGATVTIKAGTSSQNCGSSVSFVNSGSTSTLNVTDSNDNTIIGNTSGNATISGSNNTSLGYNNLTALTTGDNNLAIGIESLLNLKTGNENISIGDGAGASYTSSESSNIVIGNEGSPTESNVIRIGTQGSSIGEQNACYIAGISGATVTGTAVLCSSSGQLGTISSSIRYKENIRDIEYDSAAVMKLRPVYFNYKVDMDKTKVYGLIAEEVVKVMPDLVLFDKKGQPESIKYHEIPVLLLNEIQKMAKRIEALEAQLAGK